MSVPTIPDHTYRQAKDLFRWKPATVDTLAPVAYAQRVAGGKGREKALFNKHPRATTWASVHGAIFLFAGAVCVGIYKDKAGA